MVFKKIFSYLLFVLLHLKQMFSNWLENGAGVYKVKCPQSIFDRGHVLKQFIGLQKLRYTSLQFPSGF